MGQMDFDALAIHAGESMTISRAFLAEGARTIGDAMRLVSALPYRRNSNRRNPTIVLEELCGTCSTKHALLYRLIEEQSVAGFRLMLGIFKMNGSNTPQIGEMLFEHGLEYLPEAHCYLRYGNQLVDCTRTAKMSFENELLTETEIGAFAIPEVKIEIHRRFLEEWILRKELRLTSAQVWEIRERCISLLQQK